MSVSDTCPSVEDLERLISGSADATELEAFATHAQQCEVCGRRLKDSRTESALPPTNVLSPGEGDANADPFATRLAPGDATPYQKRGPGAGVPGIPGYDIINVLGQGGMGIVYRARHQGLGRIVALKMLRSAHASARELARFRVEAEAVARVQHPHVIQIYEIGEHEGSPYFALEYCAGGSLASYLDGTPLTAAAAASLVQKLALGMQAAHDANVIHRDLKPANVLLQKAEVRSQRSEIGSQKSQTRSLKSEALGQASAGGSQKSEVKGQGSTSAEPSLLTSELWPKIADFGLAKRLDAAALTHAGSRLGTPRYMAPEQVQGQSDKIGPQTDIYALGVILYELLTGQVPFRAANVQETLALVVSQEPVRPSQLQPRLSRDVETICLKCLEKEPAGRYASCQALADDLGRYLRGESILARPAGLVERTWKWARRYPGRAVSAASLLLFALAAALYGYQQVAMLENVREARERAAMDFGDGRAQEGAKKLAEAGARYASALAALEAHPELRDDAMLAEIAGRLAHVQRVLGARAKLEVFRGFYDTALTHLTGVTGLGQDENRSKAHKAAGAGLALYGLADATRDDALDELKHPLGSQEHQELVTGCIELLLILAEHNHGVEANNAQVREALHILERAARLGKRYQLNSLVVEKRRLRYEALAAGRAAPDENLRFPTEQRPSLALDWFLIALERYTASQTSIGPGEDSEVLAAQQACTEVLLLQADHFWGRYMQSLCYLRSSRPVEARQGLTDCLSRKPSFTLALVQRGFASLQLADKNQDSAEFERAQADFDRALQQADRKETHIQVSALLNRGVLFIRRQRWPEAIADLRRASALQPEAFQSYQNLAVALEASGKLPEAAQALDEAIARKPRLGILYAERADLHLKLGNIPAVRADLEKVIALGPTVKPERLASAHLEVGRLLAEPGKDAEPEPQRLRAALAHYDRALQVRPEYDLAHRLRAEVLLRLALGRPKAESARLRQQAAASLDQYLDKARQPDMRAFRSRGLLYMEAGQLAQAVELYSVALRRDPQEPKCRLYRGWAYLLMNAGEAALADFEECVRRDPEDVAALCLRGRARAMQKQVQPALADADAVRAGLPGLDAQEQLRTRYNLACLYSQLLALVETDPSAEQSQYRVLYSRRIAQWLEEILLALPEERRAAFWRDQIRVDPALTAFRRHATFADLLSRYQRASGGR